MQKIITHQAEFATALMATFQDHRALGRLSCHKSPHQIASSGALDVLPLERPSRRGGFSTISNERPYRPTVFSRVNTLRIFLVNPSSAIPPTENGSPQ